MRQSEADLEGRKEALAQALFDHIPVGVGSQGIIPTTAADLEAALEMGMDWSLREARLSLTCTLARVQGFSIAATAADLEAALEVGMDWSLREALAAP